MKDVLTIGKRLIPLEQIAFVEPFVSGRNPEFKPEKEFKARVVLLNRALVLAESAPQEFAEAHGMRYLDEDAIAVSSSIDFRVEAFEASDSFKPEKPFQTRLKWRDRDGKEQSKLLLTAPETVIAIVMRANAEPSNSWSVRSGRRTAKRLPRRNVTKAEPIRP